MIKAKEFKGRIEKPNIDDEMSEFLKEITTEQIVSVSFATNLATIKRNDGGTGTITISSALLLYETN